MNVNIKVSLTDEQRNIMYRKLNGGSTSKKMVSRADVNAFVDNEVRRILNGPIAVPVEIPFDSTKPIVEVEPRSKISDEFKPSRGDEPYLLKVKNESLRQIHTRMLDCIEDYETAVQKLMEANEK